MFVHCCVVLFPAVASVLHVLCSQATAEVGVASKAAVGVGEVVTQEGVGQAGATAEAAVPVTTQVRRLVRYIVFSNSPLRYLKEGLRASQALPAARDWYLCPVLTVPH